MNKPGDVPMFDRFLAARFSLDDVDSLAGAEREMLYAAWEDGNRTFSQVGAKPYGLPKPDEALLNKYVILGMELVAVKAALQMVCHRPFACGLPPPGWFCTRTRGHRGPCAAWQDNPCVDNDG
jgi:hypothetical protein